MHMTDCDAYEWSVMLFGAYGKDFINEPRGLIRNKSL